MGVSHAYLRLQDRLGDSLETTLRLWHECQVSAEAASRLLTAETGVVVSAETIRRWFKELDGER